MVLCCPANSCPCHCIQFSIWDWSQRTPYVHCHSQKNPNIPKFKHLKITKFLGVIQCVFSPTQHKFLKEVLRPCLYRWWNRSMGKGLIQSPSSSNDNWGQTRYQRSEPGSVSILLLPIIHEFEAAAAALCKEWPRGAAHELLCSGPMESSGMETTGHLDIVAVGTAFLVLQEEKHQPVVLLTFVSDLWIPLKQKGIHFISGMW